MIVSGAIVTGFQKEISSKIFDFWGHIHITDYNGSYGLLTSFQHPISNQQDFYRHLDTLGRVEAPPSDPTTEQWARTNAGVRHIQQFIILPGVVSVYEPGERLPTQEAMVLKGIDSDFNQEDFKQFLQAGKTLEITPDSMSRGMIISQVTADRLQLGLGDRVEFSYIDARGNARPRGFNVQGIYKTGLEEFDQQFALVDIKQPRRLLNWKPNEVGGFDVMLEDINDMDAFTNYLQYVVLDTNYYAENIREKFNGLFGWLEIQNGNFALILALMTIVAIINMMTALLILILERTNMVGTLKLYYAAFIVFGGLLFGNILGLGLCWLQKRFGFITLDEENYYLAVAPVRVVWSDVLLLNLGTFLITLAFLIVPSLLVTRIDPVKALRFK